MTTTLSPRGRLTWVEQASNLHTQSPDQAQAWRAHDLDVIALTDPDEINAALDSESTVWV